MSQIGGASQAASTTMLTLTSGDFPVTTLARGTGLTLIANVKSGGMAVKLGQVRFCDASTAFCTGTHLLGTAQLTPSGTAAFKFLPPIGIHSYKAVFSGTRTVASSSSIAYTLTVTGLFPSVTKLDSTGQVIVGGGGAAAPTGTVSLLNAEPEDSSITSGTLGPGQNASEFVSAERDSNGYSIAAVIGNFNGDEFADIAEITDHGATNVYSVLRVLLGDGTGHFISAASMDFDPSRSFLTVGDFNGDGVLDLCVIKANNPTIMLGNGDGTFKVGQVLALGADVSSIATGDFNGDGIPDLAFLIPYSSVSNSSVIYVYLGNGDGSFTGSPLVPPSPGSSISSGPLVANDFNGDEIADLAITIPSGVEVFLSNGDGSFASPITTLLQGAAFIAASDFNEDGNLDLAVSATASISTPFNIAILLGDGRGRFSAGAGIGIAGAVKGAPFYIGCGDVDRDGKIDLIISFYMGNGYQTAVALGKGDGTFEDAVGVRVDGTPLAMGDLNGDGLADLVDSNGRYLSITQAAGVAFAGGGLPPGSGLQSVVARYSGDTSYAASKSNLVSIQAERGTPIVSVTAPAVSIIQGSPLTLTTTVVGAGLAPTGSVTLYDGSGILGTVPLDSSSAAAYVVSSLVLGKNIITVSYGGDANYFPAVSSALVVAATLPGPTASTVTVTPASTNVIAGQALAVSVTVNGTVSGLSPSGQVNLAVGTYSGWQALSSAQASFSVPAGTLSIGDNTLTASYPGDATFASAKGTAVVRVPQLLVSIPAPPAISAGASTSAMVNVSSDATYQGTLNLSCALTSSPTGAQNPPTCTMNPASLSFVSAGTGTSTLTVHTTAASIAALSESPNEGFVGKGAVLAAVLFCGVSLRRRWKTRMLASLGVLWVVAAIGCGGGSRTSHSSGPGNPATTAGQYVFTVTAVDASNAAILASATVTITVQ